MLGLTGLEGINIYLKRFDARRGSALFQRARLGLQQQESASGHLP